MQVVLASASPRRLRLLAAAGLAVEVRPCHIDETGLGGEDVAQRVRRLARLKLETCAAEGTPVIAADTLVALHGDALGQPRDLAEAAIMLRRLSGHWHHVFTGVCVRGKNGVAEDVVGTQVRFRHLLDSEIDTYLEHNEVLDKAGAYAVQGGAASFIDGIKGPLDNVIGLPVQRTLQLLAQAERP